MPRHPVVELRQYTLRHGRRDALVTLFEREFLEPQAAVGAPVLGTFTDLDDADRFVWLRGFAGMDARAAALAAFYGGPAWQAHREAANATMLDSDNVLLLRPAGEGDGTGQAGGGDGPGLYSAWIHYLGPVDPAAFAAFHAGTVRPVLAGLGVRPLMALVTEPAANSFPRLPVREGEPVFVWLARHPGPAALEAFERRWADAGAWRDTVPAPLLPALMRKPERLRLLPTPRSPLR